VRAVLLSAAARQAPALAAQLHGAASTVDERPDGAWHAEWQSLRMLLRTVGGAAATGAELARDLRIHEDRIAENLATASEALLAERAGYVAGSEDAAASPADYVGDAGLLTDRLIAAARAELA
jgi:adenylosuccinate lyase